MLSDVYKQLIGSTGENISREGLVDTPKRAARAFKFLTQGYAQDVKSIIGSAIFDSNTDEMIVVKAIEIYSLCEHHLLPFIGQCHIGYIPKGKIIGLSKIARIVDLYARRLQIQENLTKQIADTMFEVTGAEGVGVVIEAKHLCMMMRGVEKQNSTMCTSVMLGSFRNESETRMEFLNLIASHR